MEDLIKEQSTTKPAAKANDEGFEVRRNEPNRNIVVQQINPRAKTFSSPPAARSSSRPATEVACPPRVR